MIAIKKTSPPAGDQDDFKVLIRPHDRFRSEIFDAKAQRRKEIQEFESGTQGLMKRNVMAGFAELRS
jgi:hypothetical protein